jgi:hypothetical protein
MHQGAGGGARTPLAHGELLMGWWRQAALAGAHTQEGCCAWAVPGAVLAGRCSW